MRIAFALLLGGAATVAAAETSAAPPPRNCAEQPFVFNNFWTTNYGPAKADIMTQPSNTSTEMLQCSQPGVDYALCYYSGPTAGTGGAPALPCRLEERNGMPVALCECYALTTTSTSSFYVDINAILNTCVYIETVRTCGHDGSNCGPGKNTPPVCTYIADNTLMPGADLISTFSLAKAGAYGGPNACTSCLSAMYAGCMTAPCKRVPGKENVICECPVTQGVYQVGQNEVSCTLSSPNIWSAANNVTTERSACPLGPSQATAPQQSH